MGQRELDDPLNLLVLIVPCKFTKNTVENPAFAFRSFFYCNVTRISLAGIKVTSAFIWIECRDINAYGTGDSTRKYLKN